MLKSTLVQTITTVGNLLRLAFDADALFDIYNIMGGTTYLKGLICCEIR